MYIYIYTYVRTYIHTYIHTYVRTYVRYDTCDARLRAVLRRDATRCNAIQYSAEPCCTVRYGTMLYYPMLSYSIPGHTILHQDHTVQRNITVGPSTDK